MRGDVPPVFPTHLGALHDAALREAVAYVVDRFAPDGIVAAGSILRGVAGPTSDLDVYVIHRAPWRQRVQRRFRGVPAELFVNPPWTVRGYFEEEHREGRPITAHMLATGFVVLDRHPVVGELRAAAQEWLVRPRRPGATATEYARYLPACVLDDARDVLHSDPATAGMLLASVVHDALRFPFRRDGLALPRDKDLLPATHARDPDLAEAARRALTAATLSERMDAAVDVARRSMGVTGFYAWESERDPAPEVPPR